MIALKTVQDVTVSFCTTTQSAGAGNYNAIEARYQRVLDIIRRDLTGQEKQLFQDSLSCDLAVSNTVDPGDQGSQNPVFQNSRSP